MIRYIPKKKFFLLLGDIAIIYLAFIVAPIVRFRVFFIDLIQPVNEVVMVMTIYLIFYYIADLYSFENRFISPRYIYRFLSASAIAAGTVILFFFFFPKHSIGRGIFIIHAILIAFFTYIWRLMFETIFKKYIFKQKNVIIIGTGTSGSQMYRILQNDTTSRIVGFIDEDPKSIEPHHSLPVLGNHTILEDIVEKEHIESIIIAIKSLKNTELLKSIVQCKIKGVNVYNIPSYFEEVLGKIDIDHLSDEWIVNIPLYGVKRGVYNRRVKRIIGIVFATSILLITLPILFIAIIAIKLDSPGPVFFRQKRIGLNREPFEILKLRTMKVGTENDRRHAGKKEDPRITRVGRMLRLFRIDEIPQLLNVLKGDMNFIGPRALMLEEVEEFEKKIPYFSMRHSIKPGVTGWAQVNYPHGATVKDAIEKLKYDLFYIKNLSPFLDFHIILRTIRVVLFGKGAR